MSTVPHPEGQSRIFIRCPAVPRNQQMSRIFRKWYYFFFPLPIILHVCLATQQSGELRIKIGSKFARRQATDYKYTVDQCDRCHLYYTRGRRRQQMFILSTSAATPATRQQRHCYHSIHRSPTENCSARCLIWWVMVI